MDSSVKEALAKWPNVPAVFGWLSLDERGRWRLHPQGDAAAGGMGESIPNTQIVAFIDRNYDVDEQGRWFFQNGPQRVYVRLDGAPYLLRRADDGIALVTHTGLPVRGVSAWWLDDTGRLYAQADVGPAMVDDRDLPALLEQLRTVAGNAVADVLETNDAPVRLTHPALAGAADLHCHTSRADIPARLGFVAQPRP
ncbi:hypothetical protein CAL18_03195 [Bordetella genomosp. 7]|uniref:DUF2946 family protein n=1 Tax=Bordetella genomosp. 7 TaxID=1416805 RepID=UPI000B9E9506|nr:DUF2946 family protein [Bordetella genomosp. 7]OZI28378.1 hypothetical protein CAL18_03195 [Bordetella genomosp. 7]